MTALTHPHHVAEDCIVAQGRCYADYNELRQQVLSLVNHYQGKYRIVIFIGYICCGTPEHIDEVCIPRLKHEEDIEFHWVETGRDFTYDVTLLIENSRRLPALVEFIRTWQIGHRVIQMVQNK